MKLATNANDHHSANDAFLDNIAGEPSNLKCADCGSSMVLMRSKYGYFFSCSRWPQCFGTHGCHKGTKRPLGIPANREVRELRIEVHRLFDECLKRNRCSRKYLYHWLADMLEIKRRDCHIGMFDKERCLEAIKIFKMVESA